MERVRTVDRVSATQDDEEMTSQPPAPSERPVPGTPPDAARTSASFLKLVEVVARLRAPDGCPWDREQTLRTIRPFTLEETFEVLEAIDAGNDPLLVEELGDLLLQVILYGQIAADEGRFDLIPILDGITEKLIRRHPHVFGTDIAETTAQVIRNWDRVKEQEKQRDSAIAGVPVALPALARTARLVAKAMRAGCGGPDDGALCDELEKTLASLRAELDARGQMPSADPTPERALRSEAEIGEVLFLVANIAQRLGINPEDALRSRNHIFEEEFKNLEARLKEQGSNLRDAPHSDQTALYLGPQ
jgi:MazG family protein